MFCQLMIYLADGAGIIFPDITAENICAKWERTFADTLREEAFD